jgi:outer membrane protein assembly factor BamB
MHRRSLIFCGLLSLATMSVFADWPDFRGPWHDGHANAPGSTNRIGVPLSWSETNNVAWKTPIPHRGWCTPVILGKQIWLTAATEEGTDYYAICVDKDSGKILINEKLFHTDTPEPLGNKLNSYASPSSVIEPGRVYVHFGSYGTACLDTSNFKVLWKREDLPCRHFRGPGSSPVLFEDLLILSMDGIDQQYLVALNKKTGETVWKADRTANFNDLEPSGKPRADGDFRKCYGTPLIADVDGQKQMFNIGSKAAYSHDPRTGKELWKINHPAHSGASRVLYNKGIAIFCTGNGPGEVIAVKTDGKGDVTDTHIVWRHARAFPRMPSPVLVNDLIFTLNDNGIASCLDFATGKELWQERVGGEYAASLLYADGRIYCFSQDGKATVLEPGREFKVLATSKLADGFMASPAVTDRALYLRTKSALYRIEELPEPKAAGN